MDLYLLGVVQIPPPPPPTHPTLPVQGTFVETCTVKELLLSRSCSATSSNHSTEGNLTFPPSEPHSLALGIVGATHIHLIFWRAFFSLSLTLSLFTHNPCYFALSDNARATPTLLQLCLLSNVPLPLLLLRLFLAHVVSLCREGV